MATVTKNSKTNKIAIFSRTAKYIWLKFWMVFKDLFLFGNIKNNLVKYFMQHIRNDLIIDLINS